MVTPRRLGRMTLAGQLLAVQVVIVLVVLVGVAAVSLTQSLRAFERSEGRRVLSVAETVANNPLVRAGIPDRRSEGITALAVAAESARTLSGVTAVKLAGPSGRIVTSPNPADVGELLPLDASTVRRGRAWTGTTTSGGDRFLTAHVPVLSRERNHIGELVGIVSVEREYPSGWAALKTVAPNLLTYVGIASVFGLGGSWLLARRIKRQTHGLEPREIAGLVEHREAMLHGIREGVVALDVEGRVTLVNDVAASLLGLPADRVGRTLAELGIDGALLAVLTGQVAGEDEIVVGTDRVLVLNRMPVRVRGRDLGSVTTLRDRSELVSLQRELGSTRTVSETLRAQTHEFANQLHVISGLIQLGQHDDVVAFVGSLTRRRAEIDQEFGSRVLEPSVSALLIAKTSLAAERGAELRVTTGSRLPRVDPELSADLTTVVGNLVDNALDALAGAGGWVEVDLVMDDDAVQVRVSDSGPGVPAELLGSVFDRGFTTKSQSYAGERGIGLALVRMVAARRGGEVTLVPGDGAIFVVRLPIAATVQS